MTFLDLRSPQYVTLLWWNFRSKAYAHSLRNIETMTQRICEKIARIPLEMLRRVMGNTRGKVEDCLHRDGSRLEDIIFRK
jgi:hypothetical protein